MAIKSMTGFASLERQYEFGRLAWEMRSLNHRYFEVTLRLPEEFRAVEAGMREILGRYLSRGKVDATLRYHPTGGDGGKRLVLNRALAENMLDVHAELARLCDSDEPARPSTLLRWPGVVEEELPDPQPLHGAALGLLEEAAAELQAGREREGEPMARAIGERLEAIGEWVETIRGWLPGIRDALREKMLERIADLKQPLEPGRLEQEVAFLAQKIDIDEELDRLGAHVEETRRVLQLDEPVGRRLDFLMQEFNRESNTISSKSVDGRTSKAAVDLKVLIEQIREQVQNVE